MNRLDFIKQTLLSVGIGKLPTKWIKQYSKIYLLQSFVRGFQYYNGPKLLNEMKEGDMLELVREPENKYDDCAVALHWNKKKIGFVPAEENHLLSKLLDAKAIDIQAEITRLEPNAKTWENVSVALFLLKELNEPLPEHAQYLTTLETQKYYTLKHKDRVIRVELNEEYDNDENLEEDIDYYSFLVDHSANDSIYDMIHGNLSPTDDYGVKNRIFVVRKDWKDFDTLVEEPLSKIENWMKAEGLMFEEVEKLTISLNDAQKIIPKIKDLQEIYAKDGTRFIELILA